MRTPPGSCRPNHRDRPAQLPVEQFSVARDPDPRPARRWAASTIPGISATLSHLTVLESIAMLADIQSDMPNSRARRSARKREIRQLWDAAAVFEESVSATPLDAEDPDPRSAVVRRSASRLSKRLNRQLAGAAGLSTPRRRASAEYHEPHRRDQHHDASDRVGPTGRRVHLPGNRPPIVIASRSRRAYWPTRSSH